MDNIFIDLTKSHALHVVESKISELEDSLKIHRLADQLKFLGVLQYGID
jgi:cell fate (sporulation/competence/biofilm development) regulator YmcA (YheA/YmcA/DUF963 family)